MTDGILDFITIYDVSLQLQRRIFNNIYNMASHISHYIVMSGIINPDGIKSPILSDELRINGISMWVHVD